MARDTKWIPQGVIPAVLLPFHEDLSIDQPSFRAHLSDVAAVQGLSAITINAHWTEVGSCTSDEQKGVLAIAKDEIGDRLPIVHGVYAEGGLEAARIEKMAADGGAGGLLVFPPGPFTMGQRPEMAVEHFRRVAGAADLPIIAFQYPLAGGQGYPLTTLLKIIEAVPQVAAIKDWYASPQLHERQMRALRSLNPPVNVITTHSALLMSSLVMGCNGVLSGSGSVIDELQAQLLTAVRRQDLELVDQARRRRARVAQERRRGARAGRRLPLLRFPQRQARNRIARRYRTLAYAPERRQVRPARPLLRGRHGRQGGAEDLRAVAPRSRSLRDPRRRRHHLLERTVLEPRRQNVLLRRHLPGRDLALRLRPRDRHASQQAAFRFVQERSGSGRRVDRGRRGLRVERAADLG